MKPSGRSFVAAGAAAAALMGGALAVANVPVDTPESTAAKLAVAPAAVPSSGSVTASAGAREDLEARISEAQRTLRRLAASEAESEAASPAENSAVPAPPEQPVRVNEVEVAAPGEPVPSDTWTGASGGPGNSYEGATGEGGEYDEHEDDEHADDEHEGDEHEGDDDDD